MREVYIVLLDELAESSQADSVPSAFRTPRTTDRRLERTGRASRASDRSAKPDEKYALREGLLAPSGLGDSREVVTPSEPGKASWQLAALEAHRRTAREGLFAAPQTGLGTRKRQTRKKEAVHVDDLVTEYLAALLLLPGHLFPPFLESRGGTDRVSGSIWGGGGFSRRSVARYTARFSPSRSGPGSLCLSRDGGVDTRGAGAGVRDARHG